MTPPLLEARRLYRTYEDPVTQGPLKAVEDISFEVDNGVTFGILGASGAGKSTLTRIVLGLEQPDRGRVLCEGIDIQRATVRQMRGIRRRMQAVFQDPRSSLNPHLRIATIISEPLLAQGGYDTAERRRRVSECLEMVGLPNSFAERRSDHLSGGERQRVAIARAIAPGPALVVLDEPVSSLDGPVRSHILHLLADLVAGLELAIVMVSHDIRSVAALTSRVMVMYAGRCVEQGSTSEILENPLHPYTQALLAAVPRLGIERTPTVEASAPSATGCACRTWCPSSEKRCEDQPELRALGRDHKAACWAIGSR